MRSGGLLTIRQTPPIDTGYGPRGFLQRREEDACPRDKGEWEWVHRVGDHTTFGKEFDGIVIAPGTRQIPTHNTSTQTPCFQLIFYFVLHRPLEMS